MVKILAAVAQDPGLVLSTYVGSPQLPITPVLGAPTPSFCLLWAPNLIYIQACTQTHKILKHINKYTQTNYRLHHANFLLRAAMSASCESPTGSVD